MILITNTKQLIEDLKNWQGNDDQFPLVEVEDGVASVVGTFDCDEQGETSLADLKGDTICPGEFASDFMLVIGSNPQPQRDPQYGALKQDLGAKGFSKWLKNNPDRKPSSTPYSVKQ